MTRPLRPRVAGVIAVTVALGLGSCRTAPSNPAQSWRWDRPQTTEETFVLDRYHCLRGATTMSSSVARFMDQGDVDLARFATCMAVRGYTRSETGRFGPPPEKGAGTPRG